MDDEKLNTPIDREEEDEFEAMFGPRTMRPGDPRIFELWALVNAARRVFDLVPPRPAPGVYKFRTYDDLLEDRRQRKLAHFARLRRERIIH
jgi:hypothetical protein